MLVTFSGFAGMQRCRIYLEDDRIEVGRTGFAYLEDLSRVAYRDVHAVSFAPARHGFRVVGAVVLAVLAAVFVILGIATDEVPVFTSLAGGVLVLAVLLAWWGRKGSVLRFRVDGVRGFVTGAVDARRSKRERFRVLLLERIEQAKQRALQGGEPPPPPSA